MTQSLADKIEAAEGASRELFQAAFEVILPAQDSKQWLEVASRFVGFLRAEAWLSAAEMLVPEGKEWTLDSLDPARDPRFGHCQARIMLLSYAEDPEELGPQAIANGSTPALALCAAALRARAGEG